MKALGGDPAGSATPARGGLAPPARRVGRPCLRHADEPAGRRHIADHFAGRDMRHGGGLGRARQLVEGALCWAGQARRLKIRYEKLATPDRALHPFRVA